MSCSREVKEELLKKIYSARDCRIAELSAIIAFSGEIYTDPQGEINLRISSKNWAIVRNGFTWLEKTFKINGKVFINERIAKKTTGLQLTWEIRTLR